MLRLISGSLAFLFLLSSCECKSGNRFFDLCEQVAHSQSEPLNKEELEEFKHFAEAASFQTLVAAARRIDWCRYDSIPSSYYEQKRQGLDPELPWDAPTKILAEQIIIKRPHTSSIHRLIFYMTIGGARLSEYLIEPIGKHHPELACELIELHYQKTFEVAGDDALFNHHDALADRLFYNMAKRPDGIARRLLLKKRFESIPLSDRIECHALNGIYSTAETSQDLIDFLDWKIGSATHLEDKPEYGKSYTSRHFPYQRPSITRRALRHLAYLDPEKAIAWASLNSKKLSFDWPVAIFVGWIDFHLHKSSTLEAEWPRALGLVCRNATSRIQVVSRYPSLPCFPNPE